MVKRTFTPVMWLAGLWLIVGLACSLVSSPPPPQVTPTIQVNLPTPPPRPTAEPTPEIISGVISTIADVQKAVIQIEAQGTFIDPQFGLVQNNAGRGSGFIIDPSGIAVTNNHVVTGAGLLRVWVGGDQDQVFNAKVLGVSECSDLAVIDIDGEGFPYLEWYDGPTTVGMDMYVAGFPLGDPEYSLVKGIISKAEANGDTSWASVESVLTYDAATNPGNSGGPVITSDGKVLGVHYANNQETRQAFGISRSVATDIINELRVGNNLETIGVNGQAVWTDDGSLTGVWVASVQSGSPADKAGLQGGDIILTMESLTLATDHTMAEYCNILRSHELGDTLGVQVLRFSTQEVLEGQINGRQLVAISQGAGDNDEAEVSPTPEDGGEPAKSGDIYYINEYEEELTDWSHFLIRGREQGFNAEVTNGKFRVSVDEEQTYIYFIYDGLEVADVKVEAEVENLGVNTNWVGLICRYSDLGWYEGRVLNTGEYRIYFFDYPNAFGGNRYKLLFSGGSRLIRMGKEINEYSLVCEGDQLALFINGVEVKTLSTTGGIYPNLKDGKVGLTVDSTTVLPILVDFDFFKALVP